MYRYVSSVPSEIRATPAFLLVPCPKHLPSIPSAGWDNWDSWDQTSELHKHIFAATGNPHLSHSRVPSPKTGRRMDTLDQWRHPVLPASAAEAAPGCPCRPGAAEPRARHPRPPPHGAFVAWCPAARACVALVLPGWRRLRRPGAAGWPRLRRPGAARLAAPASPWCCRPRRAPGVPPICGKIAGTGLRDDKAPTGGALKSAYKSVAYMVGGTGIEPVTLAV